jgi:predicted nucleotide-binding protein
MKPLLFVGSSVESLPVAYAVQENLDPHNARVKVWPQGVFQVSEFGLDSLLEVLKTCDFAAFIFTPDDLVTIRNQRYRTVRDNVLFELGLFMGRLGRGRTFVLVPAGVKLHLPTDLIGLNLATYDPERDDLVAALGVASNKIRLAINLHGHFRPEPQVKEVFSLAEPIASSPAFRAVRMAGLHQQRVLGERSRKGRVPGRERAGK